MGGSRAVKVTRGEKVEPRRNGRTDGGKEGRREGGVGCMGEGLHGGSHSRRNAGAACAGASVGFLGGFFSFLESD